MIDALKKSAGEAVGAMEQGPSRAEESVRQAAVSDDLNCNVNSIQTLADKLSEGRQQTAAAADELAALADMLHSGLAQFKV